MTRWMTSKIPELGAVSRSRMRGVQVNVNSRSGSTVAKGSVLFGVNVIAGASAKPMLLLTLRGEPDIPTTCDNVYIPGAQRPQASGSSPISSSTILISPGLSPGNGGTSMIGGGSA